MLMLTLSFNMTQAWTNTCVCAEADMVHVCRFRGIVRKGEQCWFCWLQRLMHRILCIGSWGPSAETSGPGASSRRADSGAISPVQMASGERLVQVPSG